MAQANGVDTGVEHAPPRQVDVRHSLADVTAAGKAFGYKPAVRLEEGLAEYMVWAQEEMVSG